MAWSSIYCESSPANIYFLGWISTIGRFCITPSGEMKRQQHAAADHCLQVVLKLLSRSFIVVILINGSILCVFIKILFSTLAPFSPLKPWPHQQQSEQIYLQSSLTSLAYIKVSNKGFIIYCSRMRTRSSWFMCKARPIILRVTTFLFPLLILLHDGWLQ